jgi:hypothetical protein
VNERFKNDLSKIQTFSSGSFKVTNEKLFIPYSAFGWGVPFLATTITSIAQFRSAALGISSPFNPSFGYDRCWFPDG